MLEEISPDMAAELTELIESLLTVLYSGLPDGSLTSSHLSVNVAGRLVNVVGCLG